MKTKRMLVILGCLAMLASLFACTSGSDSPSEQVTVGGSEETVEPSCMLEATVEPTYEPIGSPFVEGDFPVLSRIERLYLGCGFDGNNPSITLNDEQRVKLWSLMRVDDWVITTDYPETVFGSTFFLIEYYNSELVQVWHFHRWHDDQVLIFPGLPNQIDADGSYSKTIYFAPIDILHDILAYFEPLV